MSYQLQTLNIRQFRGLRDLTLSELGRVNLLVGVNNSGKTSVLEALLTYASPLDLRAWASVATSRESFFGGSSTWWDALPWLFPKSSSQHSSHDGEIRIAGEGGYTLRTLTGAFRELFGIGGGESSGGDAPHDGSTDESAGLTEQNSRRGVELIVSGKVASGQLQIDFEAGGWGLPSFSETFEIWENERLMFKPSHGDPSIPARLLAPYAHRSQRTPAGQFTESRMEGFRDKVVQLVRSLDQNIRGIEILVPRATPSLYIDHALIGLAPLTAFGDGLRRSLAMALALPALRGGLLLVDEIETAIHVSALPDVFRWLVRSCKELDVQLFATTHSLEAVDAILGVEAESLDEVVAYRLESTNGASAVRRFGGDLLHRLRYERGLDVR